MREQPAHIDQNELAGILLRQWGLTAARLRYLPVGFGDHHWELTDAAGGHWFVTVAGLAGGLRADLGGPHRGDQGDRMSDTGPAETRRRISLRTTRMEAFSDGIFAIAATLLVLDLVIPSVTSKDVGHELAEQWPTYVAYLVSFATIGNAWLNHSVITEYLDRADAILLRLNLSLLFFISVLPFPTHMLAEYLSNEGDERIAVTIYGLNLLAISGFIAIVWHYALWQRLVTKDNSEADVRALTSKLDPSLASYAVVIGIGLWRPGVAVVLYFIIALFMIIPFRTVLRELRHRRRS